MRCRGWLGVLLLAAWPQVAQAQATADDSLDETQKLGRRLFGNHCVVCHEKPQITSIQYGPSLSRESLGGQQSVIQDVISNGTPRMPGFKFQFEGADRCDCRLPQDRSSTAAVRPQCPALKEKTWPNDTQWSPPSQ